MTKKITRWLAALLPAVATAGLLFTGNAAAATTNSRITFGECTAHGNFAVCTAGGHIHRPSAIYVSVYTQPSHLTVTVYWTMTCGKGSGAGSSSGHFTTATPRSNRYIPHPYARPGSCDVAATGQIQSNGQRIRVWLSAYTWG